MPNSMHSTHRRPPTPPLASRRLRRPLLTVLVLPPLQPNEPDEASASGPAGCSQDRFTASSARGGSPLGRVRVPAAARNLRAKLATASSTSVSTPTSTTEHSSFSLPPTAFQNLALAAIALGRRAAELFMHADVTTVSMATVGESAKDAPPPARIHRRVPSEREPSSSTSTTKRADVFDGCVAPSRGITR